PGRGGPLPVDHLRDRQRGQRRSDLHPRGGDPAGRRPGDRPVHLLSRGLRVRPAMLRGARGRHRGPGRRAVRVLRPGGDPLDHQPDPEDAGRGAGRDAHRGADRSPDDRLRADLPGPGGDPGAGMEDPLMRLELLMPLWAIIPLFGAMVILCVVLLVRRPRQRLMWARRLLMVLLLLCVALRPVTPIEGEQTERMNANVFFVVDRTGSMNAEDYAGEQPRLEGVKQDMQRIMGMTEGARYSIIAFDSSATRQLPLTTDAGAAKAWIDTLTTEPTAYSQGSNVDRAL